MRSKFIIFILLLSAVPGIISAKGKKISKVVIDAGHGGRDIGAQGSFSREKDITLAVSLKLGRIINDSLKPVQVVYTRTTDDFPTLVDRHEIANKANADLFVAIHVNSTPYTYTKVLEGYKTITNKKHKKVKQPIYRTIRHHTTKAQGVETFVLGLRRNSQKESAIGEYGESVAEPGLLNEDDPQTAIIIAQYSQAFLSRSITLGTRIQEQFASSGRPDLGVKQMNLEVLAGSAMPGVLVEIGFITNEEEEAYLNSEKGQYEVAMSIFKGIRAYKADVEK